MVVNASGLYKFLIFVRSYAVDQKLEIIPLAFSVLVACGLVLQRVFLY